MSESVWNLSKWFDKGEQKGRFEGKLEGNKETAYEMFLDFESIVKIKKYSKLSDKELAAVLSSLPQNVQSRYDFTADKQ